LHIVVLYTYCRMMHGAYNIKSENMCFTNLLLFEQPKSVYCLWLNRLERKLLKFNCIQINFSFAGKKNYCRIKLETHVWFKWVYEFVKAKFFMSRTWWENERILGRVSRVINTAGCRHSITDENLLPLNSTTNLNYFFSSCWWLTWPRFEPIRNNTLMS